MVDAIKGHEEVEHELGVYDGHTKPWGTVRAERRAAAERDPDVLIGKQFTVLVLFSSGYSM